jgi:hypothetical protein
MNNLETASIKKPEIQRRGFWLSAFLILVIIANALTAFSYATNPELVMRLLPQANNLVTYLLALIAFINVILATAIWSWKKWGVIGFYIGVVVVFSVNLYLGLGFLASMPGLVGGVIIYFTTKKCWRRFS